MVANRRLGTGLVRVELDRLGSGVAELDQLTTLVAGPIPSRSHRLRRRSGKQRLLTVVVLLTLGTGLAGARFVGHHGPRIPYGLRLAAGAIPDTAKDRRRTAVYLAQRSAAIRATLQARERAVLHRDRAAFLASDDPLAKAFLDAQGGLFTRLGQLRFGSWRYEQHDDDTYTLSNINYRQYASDVVVEPVTLRYQLAGFDPGPVDRHHAYTFVERHGSWLIASDSDYDEISNIPTKLDPWDRGPISVAITQHALVIGSLVDGAALPALAALADRSVLEVDSVWGVAWAQKVVVVVSRDARLIGDLVEFPSAGGGVAAVAVPQVDLPVSGSGQHAEVITSERIVVNPAYFVASSPFNHRLFAHEITHVATVHDTGRGAPTWLAEGFAEYVSRKVSNDRGTVDRMLAERVKAGQVPAFLPTDSDFALSKNGAVEYDEGWLACQYIADRWGERALLALYRRIAPLQDNTAQSSAVESAFHSLLGEGTASFTAQWQDFLRSGLS